MHLFCENIPKLFHIWLILSKLLQVYYQITILLYYIDWDGSAKLNATAMVYRVICTVASHWRPEILPINGLLHHTQSRPFHIYSCFIPVEKQLRKHVSSVFEIFSRIERKEWLLETVTRCTRSLLFVI